MKTTKWVMIFILITLIILVIAINAIYYYSINISNSREYDEQIEKYFIYGLFIFIFSSLIMINRKTNIIGTWLLLLSLQLILPFLLLHREQGQAISVFGNILFYYCVTLSLILLPKVIKMIVDRSKNK